MSFTVRLISKAICLKNLGIKNITCTFSALLCLITFSIATVSHAETTNDQSTQVYKTVAPDGSISFSDTPTDQSQSISVNPIATIPAFAPVPNQLEEADQHSTAIPPVRKINYREFSFVKPANNSSFHSSAGVIAIELSLEPELGVKDKIKILLDGKPVAIQQQLTHTLTNIDRGTHTLTAQLLSQDSTLLKSTSTSFTIHRPSIKR